MKKMYWTYSYDRPYDLQAEGRQAVGREVLEGVPWNDEEERSMGDILLHHPLVHFYLLYVAVLVVACVWDYLCNPPATRDEARAPRIEAAHGAPGSFPSAVSQHPPRPVSSPRRRTDEEVEPLRGGRRFKAPTDPTSAPNSRNGRECHVVTP